MFRTATGGRTAIRNRPSRTPWPNLPKCSPRRAKPMPRVRIWRPRQRAGDIRMLTPGQVRAGHEWCVERNGKARAVARRGECGVMTERVHGTLKTWIDDRGFGFITPDNGLSRLFPLAAAEPGRNGVATFRPG